MFINFFSTETIMLHISLGKTIYNLSYIEAIGTVFGLLCVWYASKEKSITYFFGLFNIILFAIIFFQINLYASLLLQIFFFFTNIYGWFAWNQINHQAEKVLHIRWLSTKKLILVSLFSLIGILLLARFINPVFQFLTSITVDGLNALGMNLITPELDPDPYPLADATITLLSIVAMILMTRKYVENWILWCVIDVISVYLYYKQGVYFMAIEYIILFFIAFFGVIGWIKEAKKNQNRVFFNWK